MPFIDLNREQRATLLALARRSIEYGSQHHQPLAVDLALYDQALQQVGCCFVSLHKLGQLRGCVGALTAYQPLASDVAEHAYAAAFNDHRFNAISSDEIPLLDIEIAVLTAQTRLHGNSEAALLAQLREGVDGLTIEDRHHRATFLPAVWAKLPDKAEFLRQLKLKAGLAADYRSDTLQLFRYQTVTFSEHSG